MNAGKRRWKSDTDIEPTTNYGNESTNVCGMTSLGVLGA